MIKINTSSKTVQVTGLNSFKLEDIRNEEDHRNIESCVSASLKVANSRQPLKHNNRSNDRRLLTEYLTHIGYPNCTYVLICDHVTNRIVCLYRLYCE